MAEIRLPNIRSIVDKDRIDDIISYLFQLAEQLNYEIGAGENGAGKNSVTVSDGDMYSLLMIIKAGLESQINALEDEIGDIGDILDDINGEVI